MKVIFLQDVAHVAKTGEVKEVADGYGRNYLLPNRVAVAATASAMKEMEALIKREASRRAKTEAELKALTEQLNGKEITIKAKAGAKDKLYGTITTAHIAAEIEKALNLIVDKRKIELAEPIKQTGSYNVAVKVGHDLTATLKVTVEGTKG
jgi:large subunit ribosomal protein L9